MNILIVRVSAIGDVIHTLPAILYLKNVLPHASIHWVVQQKAASLLLEQPYVDTVYVLPDKFLSFKQRTKTLGTIARLRKISWDAIIDFQGLEKTSVLYALLRGKKFGFAATHARSRFSTWFTHHRVTPTYTNIIQKNLALVSSVIQHLQPTIRMCPSIDSLKQRCALHITDLDKRPVETWLQKNNLHNFVLLAPNTTWKSKHWPLEYWKQVLSTITLPTILLGADFAGQAQQLASFIRTHKLPIYIAPRFTLIQIAHVIRHANVLIAPDTGVLHLGDYLGAQTIGIFGPTHAVKHGPFLHTKNIRKAIQISCPHTYQKSHQGKLCMDKLTPAQLLQSISRIIEA